MRGSPFQRQGQLGGEAGSLGGGVPELGYSALGWKPLPLRAAASAGRGSPPFAGWGAGLGLAAELAETEARERKTLCEQFRKTAFAAFSDLGAEVNGDPDRALAHVLNVSLPGVDAEAAIVVVKDLMAISNGSACTSNSYEPSHVLTAMGLSQERVAGALRISWNHHTLEPDWEQIISRLQQIVR